MVVVQVGPWVPTPSISTYGVAAGCSSISRSSTCLVDRLFCVNVPVLASVCVYMCTYVCVCVCVCVRAYVRVCVPVHACVMHLRLLCVHVL